MDPEHVSSGSFLFKKVGIVFYLMNCKFDIQSKLRVIVLCTLWLSLTTATLVAADFETGLSAYEAGDFLEARELWIHSAQEGDAQAQYRLGLMLANGEGGIRDVVAAFAWLSIASRNGIADAGPLSKKLSKDYVPRHCQYEAMALVREFLTGLSDRLVTGESRDSRCWRFDAPNRQ